MNAQEAIEMTEKEIENLKMLLDNPEYFPDALTEHLIRKEIERTSIILESAKLFHLHTVPEVTKKSRFYAQLPDGSDREYTHMFGIPLVKIGIEGNLPWKNLK